MKGEGKMEKIKDIDSELKRFKRALLKVHINKRPSAYHICIAKEMRGKNITPRWILRRSF